MISLYSTLSREKKEFVPITPGSVSMYVCGPTVYDAPHIGHARSAFIFDVIRRYFEYSGMKVFFVRNVTDVDDKIINKARTELENIGEGASAARLKDRVKEVADRYLELYHREMDVLGIKHPVAEPKATENIEKMIDFIGILIKKGYAYTSGGSVYFSIEKFEGYGKLSNQDMDQMMHGVRKGEDRQKRHPLDFVLWKEVKPGEPSWASPWGEGRPGWHIECSVMSTDILGNQFDVHGGGLDLVFPHHENEIAQAEAVTEKPFANYWIHNGLLFVNGEKMSKSLGNYITISDYLEKYDDPDLLKISFLYSHYRSAMDYTGEKIEEARRAKERIMIFLDKADRALKDSGFSGEYPAGITEIQDVVDGLTEKFREAMDDDFNTPMAISVIFEAVKTGNDRLSSDIALSPDTVYFLGAIRNFILRIASVLGLSFRAAEIKSDLKTEVDRMIALREKARKEKNFKEADRIRKELSDKGVVLEDSPEGTIWRIK